MAQWPNLIERQLVNALNRTRARGVPLAGNESGQLWSRQGKCRADIKDALGVEWPTVYSPPKARVIRGMPEHPEKGQIRHVETEPDNLIEVHLQTPPPTTEPLLRYMLEVSDDVHRESHRAFCEKISQMGLIGVSAALRNAGTPESIAELAEIYLGAGQCYGGVSVLDFLRITDHLEHHFNMEGDPLILVVSGLAILPGLAFAAIDQRISGILVDFRSATAAIDRPVGFPPLFRDQYIHLGTNPLLTLMECVAPRPMMLAGAPENASEAWIKNTKSGVLAFDDQRKTLQELYESENAGEQLIIVEADEFTANNAEWLKKLADFFPEDAN